jgi:hypothetical protein
MTEMKAVFERTWKEQINVVVKDAESSEKGLWCKCEWDERIFRLLFSPSGRTYLFLGDGPLNLKSSSDPEIRFDKQMHWTFGVRNLVTEYNFTDVYGEFIKKKRLAETVQKTSEVIKDIAQDYLKEKEKNKESKGYEYFGR